MLWRKCLVIAILSVASGCGGEAKPPPPDAKEAPSLDLDAGEKKSETPATAPPATTPADAPPATTPPADKAP